MLSVRSSAGVALCRARVVAAAPSASASNLLRSSASLPSVRFASSSSAPSSSPPPPSSSSGLSGFLRSVSHKIAGKTLAGRDRAGNLYFVDNKNAAKRWVEYAGRDLLGDTETVPMIWHSWLRNGRATAPTAAEVNAEEESRLALERKVRALSAADQKLRLQEIAERALQSGDMGHANASPAAIDTRERDQRGGAATWKPRGE